MRRLTRRQYENTLVDLLAARLNDTDRAEQLFAELEPTLALIPPDERAVLPEDLHGTFRRLDQIVQQSHVDYWYETAIAAGKILSQEENLSAMVGDCATDDDAANDASCLSDFVTEFGALALRRPLSADEAAHYESFYEPSTGIDPLGFADVIAGLLNAPQFLYIVEHGDAPLEAPGAFQLAAYELASRLSYHFWETMPDARLFELAESGALLDPGTYEAEVERMWDDPRTRRTLHEFFFEWMKVEDLPQLDANNASAMYQSFAGDNLPSPNLRADMQNEVVDFLDYFTWEQPGGIEQIFTSRYSFAKSEELANIYGVEQWDGTSEPPSLPSERSGILTRSAFLATGTANTRPIMKGLFIRKNILCDQIPPPPNNAMAMALELDPVLSTRQVVEALTEIEGTGCAGCHTALMNPLGFATEGFDGLGRMRDAQELFDENGVSLSVVDIDTTSTPQVLRGDMTPSQGSEDLMTLLVDSGKPTACAVRHYFRFTFGRWEGVVSDGCALEQMRLALEETGSLAGMLKSVALTEEFQKRTFDLSPAADGAN